MHDSSIKNTQKEILSVENLSFAYNGELVLDGVTFSIHQGEYVGLVGPNGGGKSTLLKIMLGLLQPKQGTVKVHTNKIGYVPQRVLHGAHFPATVEEVVESGAKNKRALTHAMEVAGVTKFKHKQIGALSGGQRQRAFIARALAGEPELLILDEPTVGVDVVGEQAFYEFLEVLHTKHGITILLVSHDIDAMSNEVEIVLCINKTMVCQGSPRKSFTIENLEKLYGTGMKVIHHGHSH